MRNRILQLFKIAIPMSFSTESKHNNLQEYLNMKYATHTMIAAIAHVDKK